MKTNVFLFPFLFVSYLACAGGSDPGLPDTTANPGADGASGAAGTGGGSGADPGTRPKALPETGCDINLANPCRKEKGFCVAHADPQKFTCSGSIDTGGDQADDAVLGVGDSVHAAISTPGDADLFTVKLDRPGLVVVAASPTADLDIAFDLYDQRGQLLGTFNHGGAGALESTTMPGDETGRWIFVVVRGAAASVGSYDFVVASVPE